MWFKVASENLQAGAFQRQSFIWYYKFLDTVYKNVSNETFISSVGITDAPITASNTQVLDVWKIQRSTAKLMETNTENIWTERSVET